MPSEAFQCLLAGRARHVLIELRPLAPAQNRDKRAEGEDGWKQILAIERHRAKHLAHNDVAQLNGHGRGARGSRDGQGVKSEVGHDGQQQARPPRQPGGDFNGVFERALFLLARHGSPGIGKINGR
ncbi:MAG: hypothetical protein MZU84_02660 [Sphingobacterium sp.]|nr:hypothetical protein [Sphingobacterium sp.]